MAHATPDPVRSQDRESGVPARVQKITIGPSARLALVLGIVHMVAAGLPWLVPIPAVGKAAVTLAIAFSLVFFMTRYAALHSAHSIVALETREDGGIAYQTRDGEWFEGELLGSSYVSPQLTIVNLQPRGRWRAHRAILLPDNVDPRAFRRLRAWLQWRRAERGFRPSDR